MKEKFVNYVIRMLNKNHQYTDLDNIKFKYALQMIYSLTTKVTVILIISLLLGTIKETLWLMLFYSILRGFACGIHAKTNFLCWIVSLTTYGIVPFLIKFINFSLWQIIVIECICFIILLLYAPADTPKKPILRKKNRIANKIAIAVIASIFIGLIHIIHEKSIVNSILFSLIIQCLCVCPITYKIFNIPYDNYKNYKKKRFK